MSVKSPYRQTLRNVGNLEALVSLDAMSTDFQFSFELYWGRNDKFGVIVNFHENNTCLSGYLQLVVSFDLQESTFRSTLSILRVSQGFADKYCCL